MAGRPAEIICCHMLLFLFAKGDGKINDADGKLADALGKRIREQKNEANVPAFCRDMRNSCRIHVKEPADYTKSAGSLNYFP